jgi:hypothetical protein
MVHQPFLMVMTKQGRMVEMHIDSLLTAAVNQMAGLRQSLKGTLKFLDSPQVPGGMNVPARVSTQMRLSDR